MGIPLAPLSHPLRPFPTRAFSLRTTTPFSLHQQRRERESSAIFVLLFELTIVTGKDFRRVSGAGDLEDRAEFGTTEQFPPREHDGKQNHHTPANSSFPSGDEDDYFQLELTAAPSPPPAGDATNPFLTANPLAMLDGGATQSPQSQFMARADASPPPDPNRIPSSVFFDGARSSMPMEWSVASNESLFSIHLGNNSFSGDQAFLTGRSGELSSLSGACAGEASPPAGAGVAAANAEAMKEVMRAPAHTASNSRVSDGSRASFQSFAFPILTGDGGRNTSAKVDSLMLAGGSPATAKTEGPAAAKEEEGPSPAAAPAAAAGQNGGAWFPCFSSCYTCCKPAEAEHEVGLAAGH